MIDGPEKFRLPTVGGDKVEILVNWTAGVDNCEFVKFRIDGKRDIIVPKSALVRLAMFLGNEDEQDSLVPTATLPVKQFRKKYVLKTTRDIKAGEPLALTLTFDIPVTEDTIPMLEKSMRVFT